MQSAASSHSCVEILGVTPNAKSANSECLLLGDSKLGPCEAPVKSCPSTDQLIALLYECFCLRTCKLIYAVCSLIVNLLTATQCLPCAFSVGDIVTFSYLGAPDSGSTCFKQLSDCIGRFLPSLKENVLSSAYPFKWMFRDEVNFIKIVENG